MRNTEFPDLADATDPRQPETRNPLTRNSISGDMSMRAADTQDLQAQDRVDTVRRNETEQSRGGFDRDVRPVEPVSGNILSTNATVGRTNTSDTNTLSSGPLFPEDELHNFRAQWDRVQASFVDEPRQAVQQADSLVANVVKRIAEQFAEERANLEQQWDRGDDVSTEDLRQGLRRYRAFFDRLLSF